MLYYLGSVLYVLVCLVLMLVILLQQGKGGDIASAFGGGGSQAAFGARSGATVLSRATTVLAVLFVLGALVLNILAQRGPGSVVGGRAPQPANPVSTLPVPQAAPPAQQQSAPAQSAPAQQAPAAPKPQQ
ncbi:MAG: preprotein translocase subunit SecG [Acidobacteria bacterium]|nr:preprotein translocase subunit SecG [Acidobacteriota bacterium]